MVLTIKGVSLEENAPSLSTLYLFHKYPGLKEHSSSLVSEKSQVFGATSLLYVSQREFAVTHSHDNKVQVISSSKVKCFIEIDEILANLKNLSEINMD